MGLYFTVKICHNFTVLGRLLRVLENVINMIFCFYEAWRKKSPDLHLVIKCYMIHVEEYSFITDHNNENIFSYCPSLDYVLPSLYSVFCLDFSSGWVGDLLKLLLYVHSVIKHYAQLYVITPFTHTKYNCDWFKVILISVRPILNSV